MFLKKLAKQPCLNSGNLSLSHCENKWIEQIERVDIKRECKLEKAFRYIDYFTTMVVGYH